MRVLDLFSAAAGGWSLGMHRAGFETVAACEVEAWRRALYSENNPKVRMYDDVRSLTADRLVRDLGYFPPYVVGSPPCQDISSANTKGKGVDGERSGLFFEAVRIIGEGRPRGFALENSANLRTRGADRVLEALEALGYACWAFVVGVDDIGGNNERKRSWIIGFDLEQVTHAYRQLSDERPVQSGAEGKGCDLSGAGAAAGDHGGPAGSGAVSGRHGGLGEAADAHEARQKNGRLVVGVGRSKQPAAGATSGRCGEGSPSDAPQDGRGSRLSRGHSGAVAGPEQSPRRDALHATGLGHEGRRTWRHGADGDGAAPASGRLDPADADEAGHAFGQGQRRDLGAASVAATERDDPKSGRDGSGIGGAGDVGQVGLRAADLRVAHQHRPDWSLDDLARHIRLDDGLPAWLASTRVAVGGPRGTSAASLIVEAFGDSVCPQIPEAIGRAILRTEAALTAIYGKAAA